MDISTYYLLSPIVKVIALVVGLFLAKITGLLSLAATVLYFFGAFYIVILFPLSILGLGGCSWGTAIPNLITGIILFVSGFIAATISDA